MDQDFQALEVRELELIALLVGTLPCWLFLRNAPLAAAWGKLPHDLRLSPLYLHILKLLNSTYTSSLKLIEF